MILSELELEKLTNICAVLTKVFRNKQKFWTGRNNDEKIKTFRLCSASITVTLFEAKKLLSIYNYYALIYQ